MVKATPISSRHGQRMAFKKINSEHTLRVRQPHPAQWGISGHVSTEVSILGRHATDILNSHEYVCRDYVHYTIHVLTKRKKMHANGPEVKGERADKRALH